MLLLLPSISGPYHLSVVLSDPIKRTYVLQKLKRNFSISGSYHLSVVLSEGSLRFRSTDPSDVVPGILCEKGNEAGKVIATCLSNGQNPYYR